MGGMAETGGVKDSTSERFARRTFSGVAMSICSGVSSIRFPASVPPFLKVTEVMPKPGATTAAGCTTDSRR